MKECCACATVTGGSLMLLENAKLISAPMVEPMKMI